MLDGTPGRAERADPAERERQVRQRVDLALPRIEREGALGRVHLGSAGRLHAPDQALAVEAMPDDLLDAAHAQAVLRAQPLEVGHARHLAVGAHDLDDRGRRPQPRHAAEVDAALGLAGAHQHAAVARPERVDVPGPHEVVGTDRGIDQHLDGARAVLGADPGADPVPGMPVDAHRERRAADARVGRHLCVQVEPVARGRVEADAEVAAAHAGEEVHQLRRDELGRHHEVALVLAVLVVDEHDDLAGAQVVEDLGNRAERHGGEKSSAGRKALRSCAS